MKADSPEKLARQLRADGWTVRRTRRHWQARHPSGVGVVHLPSTPSDWRWAENVRADIRRACAAATNATSGGPDA